MINRNQLFVISAIATGALALGVSSGGAATVTIDAVYFAQTHVQQPDHPYFHLVGNRDTLIKAHVVSPDTPASPPVNAVLTLGGQTTNLTLTGPAVLPAAIPNGLGVVQHSFANSFTAIIPKAWVKAGLTVSVRADTQRADFNNLKIGAPTKLIMNMFDVQYFADTSGDYPAGWQQEIAAKWPIAEYEVRRLGHVVFPELVIPPRAGVPAARVKSKADYTAQTGLAFDGEQAAALEWKSALKAAAGKSGRISYYYINIYGANAGGQAGGFGGVGNGTSLGIFHHESGHALSLPHWGDSASYPYKGDMYGIAAPAIYNATHAGPTWAFDLRTLGFIPCTVQSNNVSGHPAGTYKADPMQGGGTGWQEPGYLLNHFSDYSGNQARNYLEGHVLVWNTNLGQYASWNQAANGYTTTVANNGVNYPVVRDVPVISILASVSGANTNVNMVYPPIGPYTTGLIKLFDPTVPSERAEAASIFAPAGGCDVSVRVVQGGVQKTYMLAASWDLAADPLAGGSLQTAAINLPASNGVVTKIELLLTPDAQVNGLPANPQVLYTWTTSLIGAPTGLTATGSNAIVRLAWSASTGATGYKVKRALASGGPYSPIGTTAITSYNDTQVTNGVTYYYVVSATNSVGESPNSAEASATPAPPSTNAFLADLVPSAGALTPAFGSNTFSYAATVPYGTTTLTVTPTAADAGATITVNGNPVASGSPSSPVSLAIGANVITTVVVAQSLSATNVYTLTVTVGLLGGAGDNSFGQLTPSAAAASPVAIAVGAWHSLALRSDGQVVAWGNDYDGQCDVPAGLKDVVAIAAGGYHSLALRWNGQVTAWGANDEGQAAVPSGLSDVIAVAAGTWHSLALRANGTVVGWGDHTFGQASPPVGLSNVVAVAAGGNHSLALLRDGTVVAWGENTDAAGNYAGQSVVPWGLTNVVAIAAGGYHSLAVRGDGTLALWGDNSEGQCSAPGGVSGVVALAGGGSHTLALKADSTVAAWGNNWDGQCSFAPGLSSVVAVAAGNSHSLLLGGVPPSVPVPVHPARRGHQFTVLTQTAAGKHYALDYKSSLESTNWTSLPAVYGVGGLQFLVDPDAAGPERFYRIHQW